jgi:hypothetical protein
MPKVVKAISRLRASLLSTLGLGAPSPLKAPTLTKAWEVDLPAAETVAFDEATKVLYVTGMGAAPRSGSTWKIGLDGTVFARDWATGLNLVRGSKIAGDFLFIAEFQSLAKIELATGSLAKRFEVPDAGMFNNIAKDASGNLYVTDTVKNAIYKYSADRDTFEKWLETPKLECPNGILYENGRMILAPWGTVTDAPTWATEVPGRMQTLDLSTKKLGFLGGSEEPLGNLDGLVGDGKGNYLVGDWMTGEIFLVSPASARVTVATIHQGIGDFALIPEEDLFLVPVGQLNKLFAFRLGR